MINFKEGYKKMIKLRGTHRFVFIVFLSFLLSYIGLTIGTEYTHAEAETIEETYRIIEDKVTKGDIDFSMEYFFEQEGTASWYGKGFHNRKTASGERYDMHSYSAAHKYLPFGTILRVTNSRNDKSVLVRVNDRGPFSQSRIIDLSYLSALEIEAMGLPQVKIEGFDNSQDEILGDFKEAYYFAYSFDNPLICLPNSSVEIIQRSNDFDDAVDCYKEALEQNPGQFVYLLTPALLNENTKEQFFVAILNQNSSFAKELAANKAQ